MKKTLLFIPVLFFSCVNPSMERGFASVSEALTFIAEDLTFYAESITSDMAQIEEDMALIIAHVEQMQRDKEQALILIEEILSGLSRTQELLDQAATKEQMQALLEDVQELGEGIQTLWNIADFDYDGVINVLDQCPATPLTEINNVNGKGCAPGETPVTGTTTNTTDN